MDKQPLIDFIKSNTPNIEVSKEGIETIANYFEELELSKGEYLLKEGKTSGYYYLSEGFMRSFTFDTQGNEITTYFYTKNRVIFEAASFFQHTPSTENIQAVIDCKGFYTTFEKINVLFHAVPEFREFGRAMLVKEFVSFKQHSLAMINKTAEERYTSLLNKYSEIFQYAQLKHIASFLGITDTSLSRIRREVSRK